MTEREESAVVELLRNMEEDVRRKLIFDYQEDAQKVARDARLHHDLDNFFSEADVIELGSREHDFCQGFVVRVVSASDGAVGLFGPGGRCYRVERLP